MILVSNNVVLSLSIALVLTTVYVVLRDEQEVESESSSNPLLITLIFFCIAVASLLYFERTSIDEHIQISNTVDPIIKMRRGRAPF